MSKLSFNYVNELIYFNGVVTNYREGGGGYRTEGGGGAIEFLTLQKGGGGGAGKVLAILTEVKGKGAQQVGSFNTGA